MMIQNKVKEITMRHELKYLISEKQMQEIKTRLSNIMSIDSHQSSFGYTIRSLYFDTINNRFLQESIDGINNRKKYRIRTYNGSTDVIHFEKKNTIDDLKSKEFICINQEIVNDILKKENWYNIESQLVDEIHALTISEGLEPKVIVEYDRFAFVSDIGNIRITFDQNIRACNETNDFIGNPLMIPILPIGRHILEVKYDGIIPGYILRQINANELERISFSKYALAMNVIANNGRLEETYEY